MGITFYLFEGCLYTAHGHIDWFWMLGVVIPDEMYTASCSVYVRIKTAVFLAFISDS